MQKPIFFSGLGGVLFLADGDELAALLDQPAVAGRIGRAEADDHDRRALGELLARGREQRLGLDQRRVAEHDEDVVIAARDRRARRKHGVAGAEPLLLDEDFRRGVEAGRPPCAPRRRRGRPPARYRLPPAAFAAAATCATIGRPAISCSTFGMALFMRVPSPAARMIDRQLLGVMAAEPVGGNRGRRGYTSALCCANAVKFGCFSLGSGGVERPLTASGSLSSTVSGFAMDASIGERALLPIAHAAD